jgi:hypothetical protein
MSGRYPAPNDLKWRWASFLVLQSMAKNKIILVKPDKKIIGRHCIANNAKILT